MVSGKRLIIDLRPLNRQIEPHPVQYEDLRSLSTHLRPKDYLIKWDLRDAFFHLGIHPEDQHFYEFEMEGEFFRCTSLPFGYRGSPLLFCDLVHQFVRFLRNPGGVAHLESQGEDDFIFKFWERYRNSTDPVRITWYLDDFMGMHCDPTELEVFGSLVKGMMGQLGLQWKEEKSSWKPQRRLQHLGFLIDTESCLFVLPPHRLAKLKKLARRVRVTALQNGRRLPARVLAQFTGYAQSCRLAIPGTRYWLHHLYRCLQGLRSWSSRVQVSRPALAELRHWQKLDPNTVSMALWPPLPTHTLSVDASTTGWGAKLETPGQRVPALAAGFWQHTEKEHINGLEITAVRKAVDYFKSELRNQRITLVTDSLVTRWVLSRQNSRSSALHRTYSHVYRLLDSLGIDMELKWIPSKDNTMPDILSRLTSAEEYRLHPSLFTTIQRQYHCTCDRYASLGTRQLGRYHSLQEEPGTEGGNCLHHPLESWRRERNWVFPPISELPTTIEFLLRHRLPALCLVPHWGHRAWFQRIAASAKRIVTFPPSASTIIPGRFGGTVPPNASSWRWSVYQTETGSPVWC
ncbi:reverse transcriptase domain-containing protein [Rhodopirellula baltica]